VRQYCVRAEVDSFRSTTSKPYFRIAVSTDRERDDLRKEPLLYERLSGALRLVGYPPETVSLVHFRIESQETVARDYGGS
jgi:hypothetical protein